MVYFFSRFVGTNYYDLTKSEYKTTPVTHSLKQCKKDAFDLLYMGNKEVQIWATNERPYVTDLKNARMIRVVHWVTPSYRKNLVSIINLEVSGQPEFYLHKDGTEGSRVDYSKIRAKQKKRTEKEWHPFGL